jgi:acyl-[acyl-carrier-protein]-phospholipid O-acyltransferase/long-chain-fatty-acid--[acyl-carrier-protein] ligase
LVDRTGARREFSGAMLLSLAWVISRRLSAATTARRVAIVLPPGVAAAVANLACVLGGKIPVNLNFTLGRDQVQSCLRRAEVDLVITAEAFKVKLTEKFPDFPWGDRLMDIATELQSLPRWQVAWRMALIRALPSRLIPLLAGVPARGGDDEAALLFTSGSSGEPKGVILSHRNILANLRQIEDADILPPTAVLLSSLPVFHSFGFTVGLWYFMTRDGTLVTLPSPLDTNGSIKAIKEERVTVTVGTPTFLRPYLRRATAEDLKSLEWVVVGAEKLPDDLAAGFGEQLQTAMLEGYGITETSPVLAVNVPDNRRGPTHRAGGPPRGARCQCFYGLFRRPRPHGRGYRGWLVSNRRLSALGRRRFLVSGWSALPLLQNRRRNGAAWYRRAGFAEGLESPGLRGGRDCGFGR